MALEELTIPPAKAAEILTNAGFKIGYDKLRYGMIQDITRIHKVFPFGDAISTGGGRYEFIIYKKLLCDFIKARGGAVEQAGWAPGSGKE